MLMYTLLFIYAYLNKYFFRSKQKKLKMKRIAVLADISADKDSSTITLNNDDNTSQLSGDEFRFSLSEEMNSCTTSNSDSNSNLSSSVKKKRRLSIKKRATQTRAKCWSYFVNTNDDAVKTCTLCNKDIATCGNTTNAWAHLELLHFQEYQLAHSKFLKNILSSFLSLT